MKINDVYRFQYHDNPTITRDRYWCFDGKLVVHAASDGSLYLVDTYWGGPMRRDGEARSFTPEKAQQEGELTLLCNLDDVEACGDPHCYDDADLVNLSYQHACYKLIVKRKGAKKSREAMLRHLHERAEEARRELNRAVSNLEWLGRERYRVETATDLEALYV